MLRRIPRFLRVSVLVAVLLAVAVSVFQSWSADTPGTGGWTQTQWGPVGPADRDLLAKVRMAGLWEQPTGQQAEQQASSPQVREVGQHVAGEHATLDAAVRAVADKLGVLLPTSPTAQQLGWMKEISAQTGADYDRMFVQRLREAHGNVLGQIAQVRATTRNAVIREFATTANEFVSRHIGYLEGTGLVNYGALPEAPSPGLLSGATGWTDLAVPILVFIAALLAAFALVAAMRHRSSPRRVTVTRRPGEPSLDPPVPAMAAISAPRESVGPPSSPPSSRLPSAPPHRRRGPVGEPSGVYPPAGPGESSGGYRRMSPSDVSGPHRRVVPAPGENTGSHRLPRTAPGETTGPRHSVRR